MGRESLASQAGIAQVSGWSHWRPAVRQFHTGAWLGAFAAMLAVAVLATVAVRNAIDRARVQGACLALEMAAAHGALDDARYRRVVRAMTNGINATHDRMPGGYGPMLQACADLRPLADRSVVKVSLNSDK